MQHRIAMQEDKFDHLQSECDNLEQYSRRSNLRFHGIPETGEREDTTLKVVDIINTKMATTPLSKEDTAISHEVTPGIGPAQSSSRLLKSQCVTK